ncbi:hypothetical protein DP939_02325 [Spongiactinospora rosea]|uniref:Uncharacterized protein n=1 Tax=Spongiactinospora rosea TaxID=2248750 RepID=A0A366M687_9ACTN|nr:hypothetical protein [Spongiactinospora rosea]RBQ21567.1 hypothetical protein DP939_02325 [Spongiactinospora rosea]
MTMIKRCDGCGSEIRDRDDCVTVVRDSLYGGGMIHDPVLPDQDKPLHWCHGCATKAITATKGKP